METQEVISVATGVVTVASVIVAVLPEPKTRLGKRIFKLIDFLSLHMGHIKKRGGK